VGTHRTSNAGSVRWHHRSAGDRCRAGNNDVQPVTRPLSADTAEAHRTVMRGDSVPLLKRRPQEWPASLPLFGRKFGRAKHPHLLAPSNTLHMEMSLEFVVLDSVSLLGSAGRRHRLRLCSNSLLPAKCARSFRKIVWRPLGHDSAPSGASSFKPSLRHLLVAIPTFSNCATRNVRPTPEPIQTH